MIMEEHDISAGVLDDLLDWPILTNLGIDVLNTIVRAHVYDSGKKALIVDRDDRVYNVAFSNDDEDYGERSIMTLNTVLTGQGIRAFTTGSDHYFAVSATGVLYGWGSSDDGQLGQCTDIRNVPQQSPIIIQPMEGQHIKRVVCGLDHTIALTNEGKVWVWGWNSHSQCTGPEQSDSTPPVCLDLEICSDIAAYDQTSAALTTDGVLYMWGDNEFGQVGYPHNKNISDMTLSRPYRVNLSRRVVRFAMGTNHTLALTEDGCIFGWGMNDKGQIDSKKLSTKKRLPAFVDFGDKDIRFVDVAAHGYTSAALTTGREVYMWGRYKIIRAGRHLAKPKKITIKNLDKALDQLNGIRFGTYKTLVIQQDNVAQDTAKAFDNEQLSDCRFVVGGKLIHAQKATLKNRSQYFQAMFSSDWKESNGDIKIIDHSYTTYKAFLKYLYTDKLEVDDDNLLSMVQLAHQTLHEELVSKCVDRLKHKLSANTILDIYQVAKAIDIEPLLTYCRQYGKILMKDIVEAGTERAELLTKFLVFVFHSEKEEDVKTSSSE